MRDRSQRPELEQPIKPAPARAEPSRGAADAQRGSSAKLEVSPGVKELTGNADWSDAASRREVSYEVFLEQLAHDMAYEDKLNSDQQALLKRFGYHAEPSVDGPFGFQMRVFTPSKPDFPHPVIAFRGTEFTSAKDLQADLAPQGVGHNQFRANQRRIQTAIQAASRFGRIWVTGHSLGGALAQLTAATYSAAIGRVITFQSPSIDAYSVKQLEAYNRAHPDGEVKSTHYQVAGDLVSTAGERLTPGEVVQFELKPSDGSTAKTMTAGMLAGLLIGPASGASTMAAMEAVAKHRAFPVSNAAQEHPAFRELFEEGKTFERIAGISRDTFEARKPISSEIFKNSSTSNFLRSNLGRGVFEAEKAMSDWGKDAKAREWTIRNRDRLHTFTTANLLEQLEPLLSGWVSDEDVSAFETICHGVRDPKIMVEIRTAIAPRLEELHSETQRRWIEEAIRYQPKVKADNPVQRDRLEGGGAEDMSVKALNLSGGRALEAAQRERLETHFGANLSTVRVVDGEAASEAAAGYNAKAFTQGEQIVLGRGVSLTDELAGHEVAHVIQQRGSKVPDGVDSNPALEIEAQRSGQAFAQGGQAATTREAPAQSRAVTATNSVQRLEGTEAQTAQAPVTQTPITITFSGQSAREETFSAYSRSVLEDILRATGVSSCTITSTTRTPNDQARIFYQQLTGTLPAAAYAAAGEAVRAVGRAAIKAKKGRDEVIALMEASVRTYNPMSQVSKHLADPAVLNVFDVAPSSIPARKRAAFVNAVNADARVNKFLHPGNSTDPAYHIEVPQGGATTTPPATPPVPARAPVGRASDATTAPTQDSTSAPTNATPQTAVQRLKTPTQDANSAGSTWQNRLFAANLMGTDGDRRINFTLDRQANKITGSFSIKDTGHGNITKGSFDPSNKASPLKLECQFTDRELAGQTRVLEGWFLYAENGTRKDENNDGKDDSSKAALPLLIGGMWKGGAKDYKLEPISPSAAKPGSKGDDKALEDAIIDALPDAMKLAGKQISRSDARANIPLILAECKRAGITDVRTIAYILVTASWESLMGFDMYENAPRNADPVVYFNKKYANSDGNGDVASGDGYRFRGRGFVQLTKRGNYARATKRLKEMDFKVDGAHPNLLENPDLVAENKPLAALILVFGMKEGWFSGVGFDTDRKTFPKSKIMPNGQVDFNEARWIVNGNDAKSKAPMAKAAESLAGSIKEEKEGDNSLEQLADSDYDRMRSIDRGGVKGEEVARIAAGIEIGSLDGVPGYYNGSIVPEDWGRNNIDGYDTGLKWQCVEYVRRYYYSQYGVKMGAGRHGGMFSNASVDDGGTTFDGLIQYTYSKGNSNSKTDDGFSVKPQKGDVFVAGSGSYGHVAIVAEVSDTNVTIAQQNMAGEGFTRRITVKQGVNGKWQFVNYENVLALLRRS